MAAPIYLLALAAAVYAAFAGLSPERLPPGWPLGAEASFAALALAAGLLTLGRIVQMLERLDRRLAPIEAIAARLVAKTEDFDRGHAPAAAEAPHPSESSFAPAAAPSATDAPGRAATVADPSVDPVGWSEAEPSADREQPEPDGTGIFEVATPQPSAPGTPDRHRGRDVLRHDDGTVSVRTIAGWRRFRSVAEMDEQIGPLRSFALVEGGGRTG